MPLTELNLRSLLYTTDTWTDLLEYLVSLVSHFMCSVIVSGVQLELVHRFLLRLLDS